MRLELAHNFFGRLIILRSGAHWPLCGGCVLIGRSPEACGVVIDELGVSRVHCMVSKNSQGVFVEDLASMNGTWVNGRRIKRTRLQNNVVLHIGSSQFLFEQTLLV